MTSRLRTIQIQRTPVATGTPVFAKTLKPNARS
jgi:hypothetical protein